MIWTILSVYHSNSNIKLLSGCRTRNPASWTARKSLELAIRVSDLAEFRGEHESQTESNRAPSQRLIGILREREQDSLFPRPWIIRPLWATSCQQSFFPLHGKSLMDNKAKERRGEQRQEIKNMLVKTLAKSLNSVIPESRIFYWSSFKFGFWNQIWKSRKTLKV